MKLKIPQILVALIAIFTTTPLASALEIKTFEVKKEWEKAGTFGPSSTNSDLFYGKEIAVAKNIIYIAAPEGGYEYIYLVNKDDLTFTKFTPGVNFGFAMDNDNSDNIVIKTGNWYGSDATQFTVYKGKKNGLTTNADSIKTINLTGDYLPNSRADYIEAVGNFRSANDYGDIYIAPSNTKTIMRIRTQNGTLIGVTKWALPEAMPTNSTEVILKLIDASTRTIYIHNKNNEAKIITLPNDTGGEIPVENVVSLTVPNNIINSQFGSDAFILQGETFHVRNAGEGSGDISFVIHKVSSKTNLKYNGNEIITPFDNVTPSGGTSTTSGVDKVGTIMRCTAIDANTIYINCYTPNHGVTVYSVTANVFEAETKPVKNLACTVKFNDQTNIWGRQDAILTWEAPTGYDTRLTLSGYNIYRNGTFVKTVDASTLSYTQTNITDEYTYTVAPIYNDTECNPTDITYEYTFVPTPPVEVAVRTYEGYASIQLFWNRLTGVSVKPSYYNVYRNGMKVGETTSLNFHESHLAAGDYQYTVEAVYNSIADDDIGEAGRTAISATASTYVSARDPEKTAYNLSVIYNYPLSEITGTTPALFSNRNYYRQGAYHNGTWYIAERADHLNTKDQGTGSSDVESKIEGSTGGVITFNALDPRTGQQAKPITLPEFSNVGIAADDNGNLFVRQNNLDRISSTRPSDATKTEAEAWVVADNFGRRFTSGYIFLAKDGYSDDKKIDVDLTPLNLSNILPDWNTLSSDGYSDLACKSQRGRADYYCLEGDVETGAYLYFSPSKSSYVVKVKITAPQGSSTATVDASTAQIIPLAGNYTTVDGTSATVTFGVENYAFPVDGRHSFVGQIRSNGYYGIHPATDDEAQSIHPIFTTESRVNNSGGTTIEFNNDLFMIAPQTMYSATSGDFIVTKGIKTDVTDVTTADLSNPMPVAMYRQTNLAGNESTNASGNWLFAEKGTFNRGGNDVVPCVYIYQYVPGERFAKYMLIPDNTFPAPPVSITLDPVYKDTDGNEVECDNSTGSSNSANESAVDLLRFQGVAKWSKPDYDNSLADTYRYTGYNVEFFNASGELAMSQFFALDSEELLALGNETDGYSLNIPDAYRNDTYELKVSAKYVNVNDANDTHTSAVSHAYTNDNYEGVAAQGTIKVYTNPAFPLWYDDKGQLVYSYFHRADINFNKPDFEGNRIEPVTHYEIWIDKEKDGVYETQLKEFRLMTGKYEPTMTANDDGQSVVPGSIESQIAVTDGKIVTANYDVENSKGYALGEDEAISNLNDDYLCVLTFYQLGSINTNGNGAMGTGDPDYNVNPTLWNYQLRSVYAAGNTRITSTEAYNMTPASTPIETGVNAISADATTLKLYPVPTEFILNVECDEPIYMVQVFDENGRVVMSVPGSFLTKTSIALDNLAPGYYLVKVNNQEPVKIAKK